MNSIQTLFSRTHYPERGYTFVLMPFREPFNQIYSGCIKPAISACGMLSVRGDEIYSSKTIMGDIWESIQKSDVVIAELSTRNPNVMYELGLSHAIWRKTVLITQNMDDVPFDLSALRIIHYSPDNLDELSYELQNAIKALSIESSADPDLYSKSEITKDYAYCSNDLSNSEFNWRFWVERTTSELIIAGPTLRKWFGEHEIRSKLLELIRRRIKVTVILSDWEPIISYGGTGEKSLYMSACDIVNLKSSLTDEYKMYFEEFFHIGVSTLSAVFSDPEKDDGMLVVTPRFATQHNSESRMFFIIDKNKQRSVFNAMKNDLFMFKNIDHRKTAETMKLEYEAKQMPKNT